MSVYVFGLFKIIEKGTAMLCRSLRRGARDAKKSVNVSAIDEKEKFKMPTTEIF